ncbi:MAG: MBL fold metallo-hydrolase [Saprospiraceae bacterium]|nr:MBL fold metallo-hydrolase [Saprospiraceae bacterium]
MQVQFCGAARYVTGSAHLITLDNGLKILLDCGLFQGSSSESWPKNNHWHFNPEEIDVLILSHAHIDHTGRVPQLVKDGFRGNIYCTHATRSLCAIMLMDSAFIQEREVEYWNKKNLNKIGKSKVEERFPLYTVDHVGPSMELFITTGYDRWLHINEDVSVLFKDAGHILGSASVTLKIKEGGKETIFGFSGDIGRPDRPILRDPQPMPEVDYLICESTYGDRVHEMAPEQQERFLNIIRDTCVENRGKLIIPAFSVGRTQEIVYMLDKMATAGILPNIQVYVDSPLAVDATDVFIEHPECFDAELTKYLIKDDNPFGFKRLKYIRKVDESKALNDSQEPCIIISSSGMMNAGRVKHHLFNNIENPRNTFLMVGYCSPETPGGQLRAGNESIKLYGEWKMVRARIELMDSFSAHGDKYEMYDFLKNQLGHVKRIFLVHGEIDTQNNWKAFLNEKGFTNIEIPVEGQKYDLR